MASVYSTTRSNCKTEKKNDSGISKFNLVHSESKLFTASTDGIFEKVKLTLGLNVDGENLTNLL